MATMNVVMVMGNLVKEPELRSLPSGMAVVDLRLAINESYRDREGVEQKKTVWVDVQVWDKQAEFCGKFLKKGDPVLVEGKLDYHEWQTDQGEKRNRLRVRALRVSGLGGRRDDAGMEGGGQRAEASGVRRGGNAAAPVVFEEDPF